MGNVEKLVNALLLTFPSHEKFLNKRFLNCDTSEMSFLDNLAKEIIQISESGTGLKNYCEDYQWLVNTLFEEELYFRRNKKYRLATFKQAEEEVYSKPEYMNRYMNGLLLSQLFWSNHSEVLSFFSSKYLPTITDAHTHLEIGPGHGLFLYYVASKTNCNKLFGWDISKESLSRTTSCLEALNCKKNITLSSTDLFEAKGETFSSIVCSEVLEHIENPLIALQKIFDLLEQGGRLFLNVPVNSPAPDHIYLFNTDSEIVDMVIASGFKIVDKFLAPGTGSSLEYAIKNQCVISVVIVCSK